MQVLDFILNHAQPDEIRGIEMALDRRRSEKPAGVADLDFQKMATQMAGKLGHSLDFDIKNMSKRLVAEMIIEQYPNISETELAQLLDQFVPDEHNTASRQSQGLDLPKDVRISMLDQFIRYSTGRMPDHEQRSLQEASPDWIQKYWNAFSIEHRQLLSELLKGEIDSNEFWHRAEGI